MIKQIIYRSWRHEFASDNTNTDKSGALILEGKGEESLSGLLEGSRVLQV